MIVISREELKAKIDRDDDFKLVMVLGEWAYRAKHIPGSINIFAPGIIKEHLYPGDDIVIYCSNPICPASPYAYRLLKSAGYRHVRRYAGGLEDWEAAGYPLEGELVTPTEPTEATEAVVVASRT
jgi:rhodanese-related sulfurtransferase